MSPFALLVTVCTNARSRDISEWPALSLEKCPWPRTREGLDVVWGPGVRPVGKRFALMGASATQPNFARHSGRSRMLQDVAGLPCVFAMYPHQASFRRFHLVSPYIQGPIRPRKSRPTSDPLSAAPLAVLERSILTPSLSSMTSNSRIDGMNVSPG